MSWIYLSLAIVLEVVGTTLLKLSDGFTKMKFAVPMMILYVASFYFLSLALKRIEVGVAYAVWSGFGIAIIATIGILFFKETLSVSKLFFLVVIIAGIVGLNMSGGAH